MIDNLASLQHFHLLRPYWLFMLVVIVFIRKSFTDQDNTLALWGKVMSSEIIKHLTVNGNSDHWLSPKSLMTVNAVLLCIVLVGPTWEQQPSPFTEDKSALIIALDVSATMNQSDIQPSRLLRAKQKIIELLALRGDANTALIAFAGSAHTVMPITNDSEMIRHFLDALDENIMPKSGKRPQAILPITKQLLSSTKVPGTLLLIGDGATNDSVVAFADFFNSQTHQLIVWGVGQVDASESTNEDNNESVIPLQRSQLTALSTQSRGRLVLITHDKQDVNQVNQYIENNLVVVEDESRPWHDASYPLVFVIAALFLFWFRRGWTLQW